MEIIKLSLEPREAKSPKQLRLEGKIPATLYGPGMESQSVQVAEREFTRLPAAAFSHLVELSHDSNAVNALIRHVQRKPTTQKVLNIEFYRVAADHKITVTVPLVFAGISPAIQAGGQLIEIFQEIEIECLPKDIPDTIEVDLSHIVEIDQAIHFSELNVPSGVTILNPPDEMVVRVVTPRIIVEEEPAAAEKAPEAGTAEGTAAEGAAAEGQAPVAPAKSAAPAKEKEAKPK